MTSVLDDADQADYPGWFGRLFGEATPGGFPLNSTSRALEVFRTAKSGAGSLFGFSGFNTAATSQFILMLDQETPPVNAQVPMVVWQASASSPFSCDFGTWGRSFFSGCVVCCSSTSTTVTLGTATCWFDVQYA